MAGALGTVCPSYGRHVGGVAGGWREADVVSPVSVTTTTVPTGSVTILRPRWVSQKKIGTSRWHDAAMKRLVVLSLTAALLLCGRAVVKTAVPATTG